MTSDGQMSHVRYLEMALMEARKSDPKPTNYCVGAVLVDASNGRILSTGYTLELAGNTHAEQCCLMKVAAAHGLPEDRVWEVLPEKAVVYTTMEPCIERLSGNMSCVDRLIEAQRIKEVYVGVKEPDTFVGSNQGQLKLEKAGIGYTHISGLEVEILRVATSGHHKVTK